MRKRLAVIALVSASALLATSAGASAASIRIDNKRSGQSISVELSELAGNYDVDADYALRSAAGSTVERIRGISLAHLMEVANADETYGAVQIARPGGGYVTVSKTQMISGGLRPVIYESGGAAVFLRPSSGPSDLNAADVVASTSGIGMTQVDLGGVTVKATVSKPSAKTGEKLTFEATAEGAASGALYEFTWVFRDGTKLVAGARVEHAFKRRGSYQVIVTAKELGAETSSSPDWVTVQVGTKVKSKKRRSGGGTNASAGAPASGASDGSSGDGDVASGGDRRKRREQKRPREASTPGRPVVTGQVLSASSEPLPADAGLAARSGQEASVRTNSNAGIGAQEAAAVGALVVLVLGLLTEFGVFGALRRGRRELRGASA